jgi:hypothetical protein
VLFGFRFEGQDGQAVVLLVKKPFSSDAAELSKLLSEQTLLEEHFQNDVYSKVMLRALALLV